jgi:hypothetical protein
MYPWYRYFNYIGENNVFYQRRNDIAADNNHDES